MFVFAGVRLNRGRFRWNPLGGEMTRRTPEGWRRKRGRDRQRRPSAERGYGARHQQLRKQWKPHVEAGEVACARCGRIIAPGTPWDLGHVDGDKSRYSGPEHARCNRATKAHEKARRTGLDAPRWSRDW